jgi:hypothetical protein
MNLKEIGIECVPFFDQSNGASGSIKTFWEVLEMLHARRGVSSN